MNPPDNSVNYKFIDRKLNDRYSNLIKNVAYQLIKPYLLEKFTYLHQFDFSRLQPGETLSLVVQDSGFIVYLNAIDLSTVTLSLTLFDEFVFQEKEIYIHRNTTGEIVATCEDETMDVPYEKIDQQWHDYLLNIEDDDVTITQLIIYYNAKYTNFLYHLNKAKVIVPPPPVKVPWYKKLWNKK